MLDGNHQLVQLSEKIDWASLGRRIPDLLDKDYASQWRLVSSMVYLKSFYEISSEEVIERWIACPYHRFFCSGYQVIEVDSEALFPIPKSILDQLADELIGEGYDIMIEALLEANYPSQTLH